jgi:hypothetical protein
LISITRRLAKQIRSVVRRALCLPRGAGPPVHFLAGPDGLSVRVHGSSAAVQYHEPGVRDPCSIIAPFELLADCEGSRTDAVTLETTSDEVTAKWNDGDIPQLCKHPILDGQSEECWDVPTILAENSSKLLRALRDTMETTDRESSRYATNAIQLCGDSGQVRATDGRHLLIQSGFDFPWKGQALVPATTVFAAKELSADHVVEIGRNDDHIVIRTGPWTIWLNLEKEGRLLSIFQSIEELAVSTVQFVEGPSSDSDAIA